MKVLSLFDGISCGMVALKRAGIEVERYVAYEIDKYAIQVSKCHYPEIEHRGNVLMADFTEFKDFDLIIGGSPCQNFSTLGDRKGLQGEKSILVNEFIRAIKEVKPKYFLLENNSNMPQSAKEYISSQLQCEPVRINSKIYSLQNRDRLYWFNFDLIDIEIECLTEFDDLKSRIREIDFSKSKWAMDRLNAIVEKYGEIPECFNLYNKSKIEKVFPCTTAQTESYSKSSSIIFYLNKKFYLVNAEGWELLQNLPTGWTKCLSNNQRKKVIGNGWTVDVIAHIFKGLKQ